MTTSVPGVVEGVDETDKVNSDSLLRRTIILD